MESPVQRLRVKKKTRAWILGRVIIKPYSPPLGAKDRVVKRETKQHGHTGRRRAQRPALSPIHQGGEADGEHSDQLSLPFTSEVRQTASRATSPLSLSPVRWGRRRAQRPALSLSLSPLPSKVKQTASTATSFHSLSLVRWGKRPSQRPALSPFPQWGEAYSEHSDQLSLIFPSEVRQTANTATSSLSHSPLSEADGEHSEQLSLPFTSEVRQIASRATSSLSLSQVRWGRRRAQRPALSLSLCPVRWGRRRAQRPAFSPFHQSGEANGQHSDQLSLPFPSEVRQTASTATSSLSLSPMRWGRRKTQRPALSPYPK